MDPLTIALLAGYGAMGLAIAAMWKYFTSRIDKKDAEIAALYQKQVQIREHQNKKLKELLEEE